MKLLVAGSKDLQEGDDFCGTLAGEVVTLWDCPCDCPDCPTHIFTGLESRCGASFAVVADRPDVDVPVLVNMIADDLVRRGWCSHPLDDEVTQELVADVLLIESISELLEVGDVVERTSDGVVLRTRATA